MQTWSDAIADTAQEWADACVYQHGWPEFDPDVVGYNTNNLGQNLYATSGTLSIRFAIDAWYSEHWYYNYDTDECSWMCGHYTQVRKMML